MTETKQRTKSKKADVPKFPCLLYEMLDDAEKDGFDDIVSWHSNGKSFKIHKPDLFIETIMPRYFKHQTRYKSFRRQLNLYCFRVEKTGVNKGYFRHESFIRKDQLLCSSIVRPTTTSRKNKKTSIIENRGNVHNSEEDEEEKNEAGFSTTIMIPPDKQELDYSFTDDHRHGRSAEGEDAGSSNTDTISSSNKKRHWDEEKNMILMTPPATKRLKEHQVQQQQQQHQNLQSQSLPRRTTKPQVIQSKNTKLLFEEEARSMATKEEKHHEQYFTSSCPPEQEGLPVVMRPKIPMSPPADMMPSAVDPQFSEYDHDDTKMYYSSGKVKEEAEAIIALCNRTAFTSTTNTPQQTQNLTSQGDGYEQDANEDCWSRHLYSLPLLDQTSFIQESGKQERVRKETRNQQEGLSETGLKIRLATASGSGRVTIDPRTIIHDEDIVDEIISTFVRPGGIVPPPTICYI